ncbi:MAG: Sir2 histone deacetylase Hst2 [Alyxoria varia]|nr:MAG: Sir2 histone deacetylase Hst2 [Alyxoria varia]
MFLTEASLCSKDLQDPIHILRQQPKIGGKHKSHGRSPSQSLACVEDALDGDGDHPYYYEDDFTLPLGRKHQGHKPSNLRGLGRPGKGKGKGKPSTNPNPRRPYNKPPTSDKMGNEESTPVAESAPTLTLGSRTLDALASYLTSPRCKNVVVMSGAGISTSAGIPDFRSPGTGLYANLARLNLPYAEAVFDISYFRQNPLAFYTLAHELYPGKFRPTITHSFIRLLEEKKKLLMHFTQNIDCLDREAGVSPEKIVEAHGSFANQGCIECKAPCSKEEMLKYVKEKKVPRCREPGCGGLVKPGIVFFGEALPGEFFASRGLPARADLCIVMGTSLTVQPFASLPGVVTETVPRALLNLERVGGMGSRPDDVLVLGDCDDGVRKLAKACGWLEELEQLWRGTGGKFEKDAPAVEQKEAKTRDEQVSDEVEQLTRDVDATLKISQEHWDDHEERERAAGIGTGGAKEGGEGDGAGGFVRNMAKHMDGAIGDVIDKKSNGETGSDKTGDGETKGTRTETLGVNKGESTGGGRGGLNHVFPHMSDEKNDKSKGSSSL